MKNLYAEYKQLILKKINILVWTRHEQLACDAMSSSWTGMQRTDVPCVLHCWQELWGRLLWAKLCGTPAHAHRDWEKVFVPTMTPRLPTSSRTGCAGQWVCSPHECHMSCAFMGFCFSKLSWDFAACCSGKALGIKLAASFVRTWAGK